MEHEVAEQIHLKHNIPVSTDTISDSLYTTRLICDLIIKPVWDLNKENWITS